MKYSVISQLISYMLPGFTYALDGSWQNNLILFSLSLSVLEKEAVGLHHLLNYEELNCLSSACPTTRNKHHSLCPHPSLIFWWEQKAKVATFNGTKYQQ